MEEWKFLFILTLVLQDAIKESCLYDVLDFITGSSPYSGKRN